MQDPTSQFVRFVRSGGTACLFARGIFADPDKAGVASIEITWPIPPDSLDVLLRSVIEPEPLVACLVFPTVATYEHLVRLLDAIASLDRWRLDYITCDQPPDDDLIDLGLRFHMSDGHHEAWVLGFGPFDSFPTTRRAPVFTLIMKGIPSEQPFLRREPSASTHLRPIHLADLPFSGTVDQYGRIWHQTIVAKQKALGNQSNKHARARVTVTLPKEHATRLMGENP